MKEQISRFFGMAEEKQESETVQSIPIEKIVPNRYQPRTVFDEQSIDELCQTIKTHGVIQPIIVRELDDAYELIAGERRWRACQKLEMDNIPAIIKNFNDTQAASVALIENLQREGLTVIEEAFAYQQLIDYHNLTQESLAQRLGKSQSTIANKLRLLQLPEDCHEALKNRQVSERHARALLGLKDQDLQSKFLREILTKNLNVKQTEEMIQKALEPKQPKRKKKIRKSYSKDTRLAMNTIRESVDMVMKTGLQIETDESDHDDHVEITIKIPKS